MHNRSLSKVIRLLTSRKERSITMTYESKTVSQRTRILFPIITTVIVGLVAPSSASLVGFLMFLEAMEDDEVVAVSIATRPDCLPEEILDMLSRLNAIKPVWKKNKKYRKQ